MARLLLSFVSVTLLILLLCVCPSLAQADDLELAPLDRDGQKSSFRRRADEDPGDLELLPLNGFGEESSFTKRGGQSLDDDPTVLDLKHFGSFLWGAEAVDSMIVANLTLEFEEDYEAIVDMDQFAGLVKGVDCTAPDLSLDFKDEKSFSYAKKVWNWVNTDDDYTFVLVASAHACDPESARDPFLVSHLDFDEVNNKVLMKAVLKEWEDIAVTYSFRVRNEPLPPDSPKLGKRDGKSLDFTKKFNRKLFDSKAKGLELGVTCVDCGISGSVSIDVDIETKLKVPVGASMTVKPRNLAAVLELGMILDGKLSGSHTPSELNVVGVPVTGFKIGKLFKIGAFLNVDLGFELNKWEGTAEASVGAKVAIPNSSKLDINLLGSGKNEVSGWTPTFKRIPPSINAKVEGSAEAYAQTGFELTAEGLGKGFSVGIDMKMPYIRADFSAMADKKGVCGGRKTSGVDMQASVGAELYASAALNDKDFWTHSIFDKTLGTLIDKCYGFGPKNAQTGGGGGGGGGGGRSKTTKKSTKKTTTISTTSRKATTTSTATSRASKTSTTASRSGSSTITKVTVTSTTTTASSRPTSASSSTGSKSRDTRSSITSMPVTTASTTLTTSTSPSSSSTDACPITGCKNCVPVNPTPYFDDHDDNDGLQRRAKKDPIKFKCEATQGAKFTTEVKPDLYWGPKEKARATPAITPAIKPMNPSDCTDYRVKSEPEMSDGDYATEHIYEANWITKYLAGLSAKLGDCDAMATLFFNPDFNAAPLPMPDGQEDWAGALMSSIGTQENTHLMVYFDSDLNSIKYRVFDETKRIYGKKKFKTDFHTQMALIANIGRIQNYMVNEDVREKMRLTAVNIAETLKKFYTAAQNHQDPEIKNAFELLKAQFKTKDELAESHWEFLQGVLETGSHEASQIMVSLASTASKGVGTKTQTLDSKLLEQMTSVAQGVGVPTGLRKLRDN